MQRRWRPDYLAVIARSHYKRRVYVPYLAYQRRRYYQTRESLLDNGSGEPNA
jgi:hypothetical protein